MARCTPCVEKKLRQMIKQRDTEIKQLEAENDKLKAREEVQKALTAEYKRTAFELEAELQVLRLEVAGYKVGDAADFLGEEGQLCDDPWRDVLEVKGE